MIYNKYDALKSLQPGKQFVWRGTDYSGLEWLDSGTPPTEAEIDAEVKRLQAEYDNKEYQRKRAEDYPRVVEQLDLIYHSGVDVWKAKIKETKDKYPKP
tara:strand:- start:162 stop:458 length:297 start_codon:yes stop_codon:yes gene_type:complete